MLEEVMRSGVSPVVALKGHARKVVNRLEVRVPLLVEQVVDYLPMQIKQRLFEVLSICGEDILKTMMEGKTVRIQCFNRSVGQGQDDCDEGFDTRFPPTSCPCCNGPMGIDITLREDIAPDELRFALDAMGSDITWMQKLAAFAPFEVNERTFLLLGRLSQGLDPIFVDYLHGDLDVAVLNHTQDLSGSFKDMGTVLALLDAYLRTPKNQDIVVVLASTGNMGASVTMLSRRFEAALREVGDDRKVRVIIAVPSNTDPAKINQMRDFGADVRLVERDDGTPGDYSACFDEVSKAVAEEGAVRVGDFAIRRNGGVFQAIAIAKRCEYNMSGECVVIPVGNATLGSGLVEGFIKLKGLGVIEQLPKFLIVQPSGRKPFIDALAEGIYPETLPPSDSVTNISGTDVKVPTDGPILFHLLQNTPGIQYEYVITDENLDDPDSDENAITHSRVIQNQGIPIGGSAALSFAGLDRAINEKKLGGIVHVTLLATEAYFKTMNGHSDAVTSIGIGEVADNIKAALQLVSRKAE